MMTYFKRVTVDGVENGWIVKIEWIDCQTGSPVVFLDVSKRARTYVCLGSEDLKKLLMQEFNRTDGS